MASLEQFLEKPQPISHTVESTPEISSSSKAAGEVAFYCGLVDTFSKAAQSYAERQKAKQRHTFYEDFDSSVLRARTALEDLYFAREAKIDIPAAYHRFYKDWGEEAFAFESCLRQLEPKIAALQEKREQEYSPIDKLRIAMIASKRLQEGVISSRKSVSGFSSEQTEHLFMAAGYDIDQARNIKNILVRSTLLSVGSTVATNLTLGSAIIYAKEHPFMGDLSDHKTFLIWLATYAAHYAAFGVNTVRQSKRMLKHPKIRSGFNATVNGTNFLLERFFPENEQPSPSDAKLLQKVKKKISPWVRENAAQIPAYASMAMQELFYLPLSLAPGVGLSTVISRNLIGTTLHSTQYAIGEGWIRKENRAEKMESENKTA